MAFEYNTTEEKLRFPAYGRMVQEMIDRATAESNPQRRQRKGEEVENEKVCHDIEHYTNQAITYEETLNALSNTKQSIFARQRQRFAPQRRNNRYYNPNR